MIVYEVRAVVEPDVAAAYQAWLEPHIHEILAIPGFTQAEMFSEEAEAGRPVWTVRYHLESREALQTYLRDHAPRLRAEGQSRFGGRFDATRRVLELVRAFPR